jgi:hypothetical protein
VSPERGLPVLPQSGSGFRRATTSPVLDRRVKSGSYRITSYQRACSGNCGQLDEPSDECEEIVDVDEQATVTVTILEGQTGGCTITNQRR